MQKFAFNIEESTERVSKRGRVNIGGQKRVESSASHSSGLLNTSRTP